MKAISRLPEGKHAQPKQTPETGSPGSTSCHCDNRWSTISHASGSWSETSRVCLMMTISVLARLAILVLYLLMH
jgi:hypothetical protein